MIEYIAESFRLGFLIAFLWCIVNFVATLTNQEYNSAGGFGFASLSLILAYAFI